MKAIMVKDDYCDLEINIKYDIAMIYSNGHIKLKESRRNYLASSFRFFSDNGKEVSQKEAYRLQQIEVVKRKMGMI